MLPNLLAPQKPLIAFSFFALLLPGLCFSQAAQRPNSAELLPETTVVYVQIDNIRDLTEKLRESNMGKMMVDENVAPFLGDLYQTAQDAYTEIEDNVGLSLDELQSIPAGEFCFAVIAPKRKTPAFVMILDTDEESEVVDKGLQRIRDLVAEQEIEMEVEELDEVTYEKFSVNDQQFLFFNKGGTIVIGTDKDELDAIVERWEGREVERIKPLTENRKFITIMNRCKGSKDLPADVRFFADPLSLAKSATRGNAAAQLALNSLPILGLDGLLGLGGASIMDEMDFESVLHMHVLLANPRKGIFEMLALKPGSYEPQPWVPDRTVTYASTSWDAQKMFAEIEKLFDTFNGAGAMQEELEDEINSELGIDFKEDVVEQLSGRITYFQWIDDDEEVVNGQTNAIAIGLKDPEIFRETVDAFIDKIRENDDDDLEEVEFKGETYWKMPDARLESQRQRREERRQRRIEQGRNVQPEMNFRMPQPSFMILDDHLIISIESPSLLHRAIETSRGQVEPLFDNEKFKYATGEMTKLLGTDVPGAVFYSNPEESMRWLLRVAESDDAKNFLDEIGEENKYAGQIRDAMNDNPLPDYEQIKKYFQPSGMFITSDDTGYHVLGFQLKASTDE